MVLWGAQRVAMSARVRGFAPSRIAAVNTFAIWILVDVELKTEWTSLTNLSVLSEFQGAPKALRPPYSVLAGWLI